MYFVTPLEHVFITPYGVFGITTSEDGDGDRSNNTQFTVRRLTCTVDIVLFAIF